MSVTISFADGAAPSQAVVLYDGHCRFCKAQMKNLLALARPGAIEPKDFQAEGVLDTYRGLTHDACMEEMKLILPDGRVFGGMAAAVRAVATRPVLGLVAWLYYVPGIRQIMDAIYRQVAKRRYAIAGREVAAGGCDPDGTCAVHFGDP